MNSYKAVVTITWNFQTNSAFDVALQSARDQLEQLVTKPHGGELNEFSMHVALSRMRTRQRMRHLGTFTPEDVLPFITVEPEKRDYHVGDKVYPVRMNSDRYWVFKQNRTCVVCGLEGTKMILDMNPDDSSPHFNLYGERDGRLVLMTKDHILPKALGGLDELANYQCACAICNNLKACFCLSIEQCRELRKLHDNVDRLPKKELRKLINRRREELAAQNLPQENSYGRPFGTDSSANTGSGETNLSNVGGDANRPTDTSPCDSGSPTGSSASGNPTAEEGG